MTEITPWVGPILFSPPMVKALVEGNKRQTRRLAHHMVREVWQPTTWTKRKPGDILYVREVWKRAPDGTLIFSNHVDTAPEMDWGSPLHHKRVDSRLTLKITDVHIHQLALISEVDAEAEGVELDDSIGSPIGVYTPTGSHRRAFANLWERLHGEGAWALNPLVVAVGFEVLAENVDSYLRRAAA